MGGAGDGEGDGVWAVGQAQLSAVQSAAEEGWDALVLVCSPDVAPPKELAAAVDAQFRLDKASQEVRRRRGPQGDGVVLERRPRLRPVLAGGRGERGAVRGGGRRAAGAGRHRHLGTL